METGWRKAGLQSHTRQHKYLSSSKFGGCGSLFFVFCCFEIMTTLLFQIELTLFYLKESMLFWHFE